MAKPVKQVKQSYGPLNVSITKNGGAIDKVTVWETGVSGSTRREVSGK